MKKLLAGTIASVMIASPAAVLAKSYDVMLQGFHWTANSVTSGWYNIIDDNADRIADAGFTLVWMPPVSQSLDGAGYLPRELNSFSNNYGSFQDQKDAVQALRDYNVGAVADIVINHRVGSSSAWEFSNPAWSQYTIVANDFVDGWTPPPGGFSMNFDTGDEYQAARDLDHVNPETRNGIKTWMTKVKNDLGYIGWRYDLVKGFSGEYVGEYNYHTGAQFSVGEYWDGNPWAVVGWINSTDSDWTKRSKAFDFPLRNALWDAVNGRYSYLKYGDKNPGVMGIWSARAVTFIENHDTEEVRGGEYAQPFPGGGQTLQGYAMILTHPGTPTVFWKDIFDSTQYDEDKIKSLIRIRKEYGIHDESTVYIAKANDWDGYAAYIQGDNGELAMKIGPGSWSPSGSKWNGNKLLDAGSDWAVWGEWGKWW